jgi:hypothetical protein
MESYDDVATMERNLQQVVSACADLQGAFREQRDHLKRVHAENERAYHAQKAQVETLRANVHHVVADELRDVEVAKRALRDEKAKMARIFELQKQEVKLDVGGFRFSTSFQTLGSMPDSLLAAMLSGSYPLERDEEDGSLFIDRDGRHFHHVLNYLRSPEEFVVPGDLVILRELAKEVEYYKLVRGLLCSSMFHRHTRDLLKYV